MIDSSDKPNAALSVELRTASQNDKSVIGSAELAKLAHELKTPLSAIAAAAEIMRDERFGTMANPRYRGYASDIHDNARHALAVIGRMLTGQSFDTSHSFDASQWDSDALLETFDLNSLAASCVATIKTVAVAGNRKLKFEAARDLPTVRSDPTIVRQILLNLLTNAVKYTEPNDDIRVETGLLPTGAAYLVVRDTGPGISLETLASTNCRCTHVKQNPETDSQGIGLPLVRELARKIRASFDLDSTLGKGTVALLSFPARHA